VAGGRRQRLAAAALSAATVRGGWRLFRRQLVTARPGAADLAAAAIWLAIQPGWRRRRQWRGGENWRGGQRRRRGIA